MIYSRALKAIFAKCIPNSCGKQLSRQGAHLRYIQRADGFCGLTPILLTFEGGAFGLLLRVSPPTQTWRDKGDRVLGFTRLGTDIPELRIKQAKIVISHLQTKQVNREGCTVGRTKVGPGDTPNISDGVVPCLEPHRAGSESSRPKILFLAFPRTIDKNS